MCAAWTAAVAVRDAALPLTNLAADVGLPITAAFILTRFELGRSEARAAVDKAKADPAIAYLQATVRQLQQALADLTEAQTKSEEKLIGENSSLARTASELTHLLHRLNAEAELSAARLSDHLQRLDEISKDATSRIAKRAYALDAAMDGVLDRAKELFELVAAVTERRILRAEARPEPEAEPAPRGLVVAMRDLQTLRNLDQALWDPRSANGPMGAGYVATFEGCLASLLADPRTRVMAPEIMKSSLGRRYRALVRARAAHRGEAPSTNVVPFPATEAPRAESA